MDVKRVYINSNKRDVGGTDESFTVSKVSTMFERIPRRVKLLKAKIPFTWDNITTSNNKFSIIESGPTTIPITIATGHYTGATLADAVQAAMNLVGGQTYTVVYDPNTFTFQISSASPFQLDFTVDDSMASSLGFTNIITTSSTELTSPNVAILQPDTEVFISSNLISGIDNGVVPWFSGSTSDFHILGIIPMVTPFGSLIDYEAKKEEPYLNISQSEFAKLQNTNYSLSFTLFFLSGIPINLRGAHWSAELLFEF